MYSIRNSFRPIVLTLLLLLLSAAPVPAKKKKAADGNEDPSAPAVAVSEWLLLGPAPRALPAFHDAEERGLDLDGLLEAQLLPWRGTEPSPGGEVGWFGGSTLRWARRGGERLELKAPNRDRPAVAWVASWIESPRFQKVELELHGAHRRQLWIGRESVASGRDGVKGTALLTRGRHRVWVKTVFDPDSEEDWELGLDLRAVADDDGDEEAGSEQQPAAALPELRSGILAKRGVEMRDITDAPTVGSLALEPSGRRAAMTVRRIVPGTHDSESWLELRDVADGRLLESWRGRGGARSVAWSPDGGTLSFVRSSVAKEGGSDLMLMDVDTRQVVSLLEGVEDFGSYRWAPDSKSLIFSTRYEEKPFEKGVKLLEGLRDRWGSFRTKSLLHQVHVADGLRRQLTAGAETTSLTAIAPDASKLLFTRSLDDYTRRPYTTTELWELDLRTLEPRKVRDFVWVGGMEYSPDGRRLLVQGAPSAFGSVGENVGSGLVSNSYDSQLYIWDPATDDVEAITRDFGPAVSTAAWSRADGKIYLVADDRDFTRLYRYDPATQRFETLDTTVDSFGSLTVADEAPIALGTGTSAWVPQQLIAVNLDDGRARRLPHPGADWWDEVEMGSLKRWTFTASNGTEIEGRVYMPADFDPSKKYPLIVYYYGGTSPVGRDFGGRYPKEWWAAQGYVVYVLQPSGATGFGQEFSARHVNDWGKTSSEEIIEGTRKFLEAHPFIDRDGVGCIGASYGGFMTMLLSTKTDLFAGAVAHAGISSIASYWGEGYWGYLYSSVATADSFPWNRPDVYVDQSPLFRADQNRVPILLTHGVDDTNVPVGESDQFYIALKLLGKEVEYLQVEGEDHWILDHERRHLWSKSIVAWFDKRLKKDPSWWDALYGDD